MDRITALEQNPPNLSGGRFRYSPVGLLGALVLLLVTTPIVEDIPQSDLLEPIFMTLVMISAVLAVGARRRTLALACVLVAPALVGKWVNHFRPDLVPPSLFLGAALVFIIFVIGHLIRFTLRAPQVDANVLSAGISAYLMLGLTWAVAYRLISRYNPQSFSFNASTQPGATMDGFNAFYFSFSTLSTVGYGDITPMSRGARMLAVAEAVTGMFYVTILIARLVAIYSTAASLSTTTSSIGSDSSEPPS